MCRTDIHLGALLLRERARRATARLRPPRSPNGLSRTRADVASPGERQGGDTRSVGEGLLGAISLKIQSSHAFDTADQRAGLILLGSMLLSFGFIRFSTRMIRAEVSWWPGNVTPGGLHIHHLVFGIVLLMFSGFLSFVLQPASPWFEILAGLFGIGVGLTLDEFALWLHLEDVYWTEEGRSSVDAVIFAAIIGGGHHRRIRAPRRRRRRVHARDRDHGPDRSQHLRDRRAQGQAQRRGDRHVHPARRLGGRDSAGAAGFVVGASGATARAAASWSRPRPGRRATTGVSRRFQDLIGGRPVAAQPARIGLRPVRGVVSRHTVAWTSTGIRPPRGWPATERRPR